MDSFSHEILVSFFQFFEPQEASIGKLVCKTWNEILNDEITGLPQHFKIKREKQCPSFDFEHRYMRYTFGWAAARGYVDILEWCSSSLLKRHRDICSIWNFDDMLMAAGKYGHLEVIKFICSKTNRKRLTINDRILFMIARKGHINVLKLLHENGFKLTELGGFSIYRGAAMGGHLDILEWARFHKICWDEHQICDDAAMGGNIEILQWIIENGGIVGPEICSFTADCGELGMLKWLHSEGNKIDEKTFVSAINSGDIETIQWLYEEKCKWNDEVFYRAVEIGNIEVIKFLRERGCPIPAPLPIWDSLVYWSNSNISRLDFLKWMFYNGLNISDNRDGKQGGLWDASIELGLIEILEWAKEVDVECSRIEIDDHTIPMAIEYRRLDVLKWAVDNGYPYDKEDLIEIVIETNDPSIFEYVHSLP